MALYKYRKDGVEGIFLAEREQIEERIANDHKANVYDGLAWKDLKYLTNDENIIKFVTDHGLVKGHDPLKETL